MGIGESKDLNEELRLFSVEEKAMLQENFTKLSKNSNKVDRHSFESLIKQLLSLSSADILASRICDLMTGQIPTNNTVMFDGYVHCASIMIKGMLEDQAIQFLYLAKGKKGEITQDDCFEFLTLLIKVVFQILHKLPAFHSWDGNYICKQEGDSVTRLSLALMKELLDDKYCLSEGTTSLDKEAICLLLSSSSLLNQLFTMLSRHIFQFPINKGNHLIPLCRGLPSQVYPSWLTLSDIIFLNSALPNDYRSEWRFLFSSRTHGESFSSLMGSIVDKGPSLVFIKDFDGHIFGGFASANWTIGPQFNGTRENFVFSLAPRMAIYSSTGFNNHFQYLNIQQQTFPNGLGMGGQLDYFAIWIDSEYGKGKCSPSCTTYSCPQLSGSPEFSIDLIEVWAVGPIQTQDEDDQMNRRDNTRSVLDTDPEARAMLDIIGKQRHSEGIREPTDEESRPSILDVDVEGVAMLRMLNRGPVSEGIRDNPTSDEPEEKELYVTSVSG